MCRNKIKICMILLLFIFIINISIPVQASLIDEIWNTGAEFLSRGKEGGAAFNGTNMEAAVKDLFNLFWWAGLVIAVIVGAFLGIKFMTESVEGKAKIKEALIPFCVGCVIIFGGFTIWRIAMNLFNDMESEELATAEYVSTSCGKGNHDFNNNVRQISCLTEGCPDTCYHQILKSTNNGDQYGSYQECENCEYVFYIRHSNMCNHNFIYSVTGYTTTECQNGCGYGCDHKNTEVKGPGDVYCNDCKLTIGTVCGLKGEQGSISCWFVHDNPVGSISMEDCYCTQCMQPCTDSGRHNN